MQSWQKLTKGEQGSILTKNWWTPLNCLLNLLNFKTNLFKLNLHFISRGFSVISQISPKITKIFVYVWATSSKLVIERKIIRIVFPKSLVWLQKNNVTLRLPQRSNTSSYNSLFFKLIISERLFCCSFYYFYKIFLQSIYTFYSILNWTKDHMMPSLRK